MTADSTDNPAPTERLPEDDLLDLRTPRPAPLRLLWVVGTLEAVSLAVLLVNLFTADLPRVSQAIGPVHGMLYLIGIVLVLSHRFPPLGKVLVLVPAIGTLLAAKLYTPQDPP